MKAKVCKWGNSQGIRITGPMLEHLNVTGDDEVDIELTDTGIEIRKTTHSMEYVRSIAQEAIDDLLATSKPVNTVNDPYAEAEVDYLVITINPCKPIIREVEQGTAGSYRTLTDAKEAARQVIQNAITEARSSLTELRQVGVENITYISL